MDWFSYLSFGGTASLALFVAAALVFFATRGWREVGAWNTPIYACTLVCVLTLAAAVVISLHTAILTSRNMIVVLPALYVISAELASYLARRWGPFAGAAYLATQIALMSQPIVDYYTKEMKEEWRDTTALVLNTPGCEAGTIYVYGDAAYYRFFTGTVRPGLHLLEIREGDSKDLSRDPASSCPILLRRRRCWSPRLAPGLALHEREREYRQCCHDATRSVFGLMRLGSHSTASRSISAFLRTEKSSDNLARGTNGSNPLCSSAESG